MDFPAAALDPPFGPARTPDCPCKAPLFVETLRRYCHRRQRAPSSASCDLLRLGSCPASGVDHTGEDPCAAGAAVHDNALIRLGHGDRSGRHRRIPRPGFRGAL